MNVFLIATLIVAIITCFLGLTQWVEFERRKRFLDRFDGRSRIPYKLQLDSILPMESVAEAALGWQSISRILRVDPDLLRPDDRFDGILSEDPGFPVEGEFHDLSDELAKASSMVQVSENIRTVVEAARILGAAERIRKKQ